MGNVKRRFFKIVLLLIIGLLILGGAFYLFQFSKFRAAKEVAEEAEYKQEHTLTIYIKTDVPESQILALKSLIESQNGVQSAQYVSADQALAHFKAEHQGDNLTLQALDNIGGSPLGANLIITVSDPSVKESLTNVIQSDDVIDRIN